MARQFPSPYNPSPDVFGALVDQLAETIARRVVVRIEAQLIEARNESPQDAYRVDQAATKLGLSATEVKRRIRSGELASVKVGRARLIPQTAIDRFLESRNGTATH
jgi:excisionase family DNA binding protein